MRVETDLVIEMPRILVFYVCQRDNTFYNPSSEIDFPLFINTSNSETALEYRLTGKVFSTQSTGLHFYAKVIREFGEQCAVYHYDDLARKGKSIILSTDPMTLSGKEELTVMAMYSLACKEEEYKKYFKKQTGSYH